MKYNYHRKYKKEHLVAKRLDRTLIKRLFSYLIPYKGWLAAALSILVTAKGIEACVPIYIGKVTQQIIGNYQETAEVKRVVFSAVLWSCLGMIGLVVMGYLLEVSNVILKSWIGQKAIYTLRTQVYRHILDMPLSFYNRNAVGKLMTRTIHDVDQIDQMFTDSVIPLLGNLILFICIAVGAVYVEWRVAVMLLFILPLVSWILYVFRINQRRSYELIRAIVSSMNAFVQEHLSGVMTIRSFGLEDKEKKRFNEINEDQCNAYMESVQHFGFFIAGVDFLSNLTLIVVFVVLVVYAPIGLGFQVGTYFMFSLYTLMLFRPLIDLAERYNILQSALAASERVFDILDGKREDVGPENGPDLNEVESIEFKNVWFAYEKEHWILKGISFRVGKGETLGIVGVTGAGKSTLMNLLLRLYDFQKGQILINGKEIQAYSVKSLRNQFGVIFQDPVLFSGSFEENIGLYDPAITEEQIEKAVDFVNLRAVVERYPEGVKHHLSERGKSLSMGEMQLVSLARVMAHHRSVLVFDEATANIDTETEKRIQGALDKVLKVKTALVIAHRLSTIKDMTRIIVLHHGTVAEAGTHQELLKAGGIYEKLYKLQYASF